QARAQDAAGNVSGWSPTRSFQLDTAAPSVPALGSPEDGGWVKRLVLKATFSKASFAGTGSIDFRICSDPLCVGVVRSGTSDTLVNGAETAWSPATQRGDGVWYWQARAHDSALYYSAWSSTHQSHNDTVSTHM